MMESMAIPYFPLECSLDEKFELIEAEFGLNGFGVIVKLFQRIYGGEGYYTPWTKDVALVFARKVGLGANAVSEIVAASIRRGLFDQDLYERYQILTSEGIQERYFEAVKRRKEIKVVEAYLLVPYASKNKNVDISAEIANKKPKNERNFKQRREEKRREEKSSCAGDERRQLQRMRGSLGKGVVLLTEEQDEDLLERLGLAGYDHYVSRLADFIISKKATVGNHYATILKWYREDTELKGENSGVSMQ